MLDVVGMLSECQLIQYSRAENEYRTLIILDLHFDRLIFIEGKKTALFVYLRVIPYHMLNVQVQRFYEKCIQIH